MGVRRVLLEIGSLELAGNRPSSEIVGAGGSTAAQTTMGIWTGAAWADLTPGINTNPNVGDDRWGPEIMFRQAMLPEFPSEKLWLVKYCVASSLFPLQGVSSWSPSLTGGAYSGFITWLTAAAAAAFSAGDTLRIDGIVLSISATEMLQTAGARAYGEMLYELIATLRAVIPTISHCAVGSFRDDGGKTPVVLVEPHYEWTGSSDNLRGAVATRRLAIQRLENEVFDRISVYRTHHLDDDGGGVHFSAESLVIAGQELPRLLFAPQTATELATADSGNDEAFLAVLIGDSIMDGSGANASLPSQQTGAMSGCLVWAPERGQFETLQAGVNNQTSIPTVFGLHGPEMTLAELLRGENSQIWMVKGACLGSYATRHHASFLFGVAPTFDVRVTDWHPASRQEYFDLYIRGSLRSAIDSIRRDGKKPKLGPVFISLGTNDIVSANASYPGISIREISHPDEIGIALEQLAVAITEEVTNLGVDITAMRIVFTIPATDLSDVEGAVDSDVQQGRDSIFAMLARRSDYKGADLTGVSKTDDIHPDAAGNRTYARRLYDAWASEDTSRTQPVFVPTTAQLRSALRLSAVPDTNDAVAIIENAMMETRVELYQTLGETAVDSLRSYASTRTPSTTAELLRKMAETTEVKMVRLRLMRILPMMFLDGSSPVQTWQEEAAAREANDRLIREEIRRLENEVQSNLRRLTSLDFTSPSTLPSSVIYPDDTIAPGDTIFVRTI